MFCQIFTAARYVRNNLHRFPTDEVLLSSYIFSNINLFPRFNDEHTVNWVQLKCVTKSTREKKAEFRNSTETLRTRGTAFLPSALE